MTGIFQELVPRVYIPRSVRLRRPSVTPHRHGNRTVVREEAAMRQPRTPSVEKFTLTDDLLLQCLNRVAGGEPVQVVFEELAVRRENGE